MRVYVSLLVALWALRNRKLFSGLLLGFCSGLFTLYMLSYALHTDPISSSLIVNFFVLGVAWSFYVFVENMGTGFKIWDGFLSLLCLIMLFLEFFAGAYWYVYSWNHSSFQYPGATSNPPTIFHQGWEFLYYSIVTFTTTGYGDVSPLSPWAKGFASAEMLSGWLMSTILVALLVSRLSDFFLRKASAHQAVDKEEAAS